MEEADPSPSSLGNYKPVRRHRVASPVGTVGKKRRRKLQKLVKTLADSNYFALPPLPPPHPTLNPHVSLFGRGAAAVHHRTVSFCLVVVIVTVQMGANTAVNTPAVLSGGGAHSK